MRQIWYNLVQVNELAKLARDIERYTKHGRRVPISVWESYDRINKRHKKHEEITALSAEMMRKAGRSGAPSGNFSDLDESDPKRPHAIKRPPNRTFGLNRVGSGCTFGSGRDEKDPHSSGARILGHSSSPVIPTTRSSSSKPSWGWYEREKLNELCEYTKQEKMGWEGGVTRFLLLPVFFSCVSSHVVVNTGSSCLHLVDAEKVNDRIYPAERVVSGNSRADMRYSTFRLPSSWSSFVAIMHATSPP